MPTLMQLVFPNKCMGCGEILVGVAAPPLCSVCEEDLLKEHICEHCGKPYRMGEKEETCIYCYQVPAGITRVIGAVPYAGQFRDTIRRWKYNGVRKHARSMAQLLLSLDNGLSCLQIDAIIPVPLATKRYRHRGFNQALDLANELGSRMQVPVLDILRRKKETRPQSQCSREERQRNMAHTMGVQIEKLPLTLKRVLIVDDIYTTGSTVAECIRAIRGCYEMEEVQCYVVVAGIAIG